MIFTQSLELARTKRLLGMLSSGQKTARRDAAGSAGVRSLVPEFLRRLLEFAAVEIPEIRAMAVKAGICTIAALLVVFLSGRAAMTLLVLVFPALQFLVLKNRALKRARVFEKDYTALLLSLASAVRTGLDPLVALAESGQLFPAESEIGREISKTRSDIDRGISEEALIRNFASSIDHPDLNMFRTAFILARKEGSSLSECLQRLARVTRQRQSFRRKINSAVAMQKLSAFGIAGCTIIISMIQWIGNPASVKAALENPTGLRLLVFGAGLVFVGLVWMLRLARSRI